MVKNLPAGAGDTEAWARSLGREDAWRRERNPLQYSCLESPMDRGARWATVHRVAESDTTDAT